MADQTFGIIGGTGMLGSAILRAVVQAQMIAEERIWVASRSGQLDRFSDHPGLSITTDTTALIAASDVVLLCVPPAAMGTLSLNLRDKLVISVMAGITIDRISELTGARRIIRAMSSPAAAERLAYSPWVATEATSDADRAFATALFEACGSTDRITQEAHLDVFTAMTGPVPGFVAYFAEVMADYAEAKGLPPEVADKAVRQLFLGAGQMMATGAARPSDHVQEMIDYAGTTAAGLEVLRASDIGAELAKGLDAAVARCRTIG